MPEEFEKFCYLEFTQPATAESYTVLRSVSINEGSGAGRMRVGKGSSLDMFFCIFFDGIECVGHFVLLRDVWIPTERDAVASWRANNLATQLPNLATHLPYLTTHIP